MASIPDWQQLAASKRENNANKIRAEWRLPSSILNEISETSTISVLNVPRECGILSQSEIELTENYDASSLVHLMSSGKVTSYDVTLAFCKRAAIAQQLVNCCTEIMFEEALVRAKQCDEHLEREKKPMGALHGLPISLKDSFNVKGAQATIGYVSFLKNPPATSNSAVVDILFRAGAVFYVKTNLPQTMMTADSHNNVFGRTLNPNKLCLTAGGSTGGEGALLALRGSVLGLATDIAGSNRIPALCNGVSSFKPTAARIPFGGGVPPGRLGSPGSILPVIGPTGRSVRDYELVLKTVVDSEPWEFDENALNVPWRRVEPASKPLHLGLLRGHPKRPLHPSIARALHTACTALKEAGHSIVLLDDKVPDVYDAGLLAWKFFPLDPKKTAVQHIKASGEPWIPSIAKIMPEELKGWEASLDELWDCNVARAKVLKAWKNIMVNERLDGVICPGYQGTAPRHDTFGALAIYTTLQSLLNYPSGILPFLEGNEELDKPFFKSDVAYTPPYEPEMCEGAPAHIQLMGKPMKDEELIEMMKVVEGVLKKAAAT